jgi:hypothetical protein
MMFLVWVSKKRLQIPENNNRNAKPYPPRNQVIKLEFRVHHNLLSAPSSFGAYKSLISDSMSDTRTYFIESARMSSWGASSSIRGHPPFDPIHMSTTRPRAPRRHSHRFLNSNSGDIGSFDLSGALGV